MRPLRTLIRDYTWIHLGIGIVGHTCFLVGSVFFLYPHLKHYGTWLFIVGAAGMLTGKVGSAFVEWDYSRERRRHDGG